MDRGASWATVHQVSRVGHYLATETTTTVIFSDFGHYLELG